MRVMIGAAALATAGLLAGCADMATGLAMYSDQLALEQGSYWDDEHHAEDFGTDYCPGLLEFGRVNNQTYARARNRSSHTMSATLIWNTGAESSFYLSPGETSEFVYMSPSIVPDGINSSCD